MGSDSPRSREEARDRLIRCGGTLTTASPSASRSRSSREVTARQYSTPQTRSVPNLLRAHCTPSPCAALVVAMVFWPSLPPVLLTATRVWVFLWASTPITTSIADYSKEDRPAGLFGRTARLASFLRARAVVVVSPGVGNVHASQPEGGMSWIG